MDVILWGIGRWREGVWDVVMDWKGDGRGWRWEQCFGMLGDVIMIQSEGERDPDG